MPKRKVNEVKEHEKARKEKEKELRRQEQETLRERDNHFLISMQNYQVSNLFFHHAAKQPVWRLMLIFKLKIRCFPTYNNNNNSWFF